MCNESTPHRRLCWENSENRQLLLSFLTRFSDTVARICDSPNKFQIHMLTSSHISSNFQHFRSRFRATHTNCPQTTDHDFNLSKEVAGNFVKYLLFPCRVSKRGAAGESTPTPRNTTLGMCVICWAVLLSVPRSFPVAPPRASTNETPPYWRHILAG